MIAFSIGLYLLLLVSDELLRGTYRKWAEVDACFLPRRLGMSARPERKEQEGGQW